MTSQWVYLWAMILTVGFAASITISNAVRSAGHEVSISCLAQSRSVEADNVR